MANTGGWTVNNPATGQIYYAPSQYWAVPQAGTNVVTTVQTFDSNGNLVTTSTTTAIVRDQSTSVDSDFSYNNGNTVNSQVTNPNGSDIYGPGGIVYSSVAKMVISMAYTGSAYNQPPNAPTNLAPSGVVNTLTPTFTGKFSDPNSGNTLSQYRIQLYSGSNGSGALVWDSGNLTGSGTSFSKLYNGPALSNGTAYSWRAQTADNYGSWGAWSAWVNINTATAPSAPSSVAPANLQASLTPAWSFVYSHPSATAMAKYRYTITTSGGATVYDTGLVTASAASGTTVSGTIPSAANLAYGGQYYFNVYAVDTNNAQSATTTTSFAVAVLPVGTPASPVNNATSNSQTPTLSWAYTDPNYTQAKYQAQLYNATTGALIQDSGQVSSAATSYTPSVSTAYNTQVYWRVQVWDSAGLASGWSANAYFYINNTPTVTLTAPTSGGTVTTNTPTITWTYTASSGGYAQAQAVINLYDALGSQLYTATQAGAGTSYALPAGYIINGNTYQVQVVATDTNSGVGQSALTTFSAAYNPPADLAGQPLANAKNFATSPYLNTDSGTGVATNWTSGASSPAPLGAYSIDASQQQGVQLASGDGFVTGAQQIQITGDGASAGSLTLYQDVTVSTAGWTAGSTHLSLAAWLNLLPTVGNPSATLALAFYNGTTLLSTASGSALTGASGGFVRQNGPQNALIPSTTTKVRILLTFAQAALGDRATLWAYGMQLEAASANDANFIAGDLGPGYSYSGAYSVRTQLTGNVPTLVANPGQDGDPITALGGSLSLIWDTTLADATRFTSYLIERRRQDQATDDTAWVTLATITNKAVGSYTDLAAGNAVAYQYSVRQTIIYSDGTTGISSHRALVSGSVVFSPAWYITSTSGPIYNLRLSAVDISRQWEWVEQAEYSTFLGRVGQARDAGPDLGYKLDLVAYFDRVFGDDLAVVRRTLVTMQRANVVWNVRSPQGMVIPMHLGGPKLPHKDVGGDTLLTVTLPFVQAQDTTDY